MPFPAINPSLARALEARGYQEPTPVQAAVLEPEASGRDLLVSAQTGSGKTVAYGLALAPALLGEAERLGEPGKPLALIIAPTRELAMQVQKELIWLYSGVGGVVRASIGGMDVRREAYGLEQGCHIVVGTPGRLRDHLERGRLDLSSLQAVVLDEADEMLDLGFREDIEFLLDATPAERRTFLFSATIPRDIASLARSYQRDALRIDTVDRTQPHADIEYRALRVAPHEIEHAVVNVLRLYDARAAIVFCQTREAVRRLHGRLVERGFAAVALSGEFTQGERSHALQALRDGRARVCVATDVAARGIDLPGLELVIHAELPNDRDTLLHRSGRTGRAGRKGVCVLLSPHNRWRKAEGLIHQARIDVTWAEPPSAAEIRLADQTRLLEDPIFTEAGTPEDDALAEKLAAERAPQDIARALARMFRARLPEPEVVFDAREGDEARRQARKEQRERPDKRERQARKERVAAEESRPHDPAFQRPNGPMVWFRMNVGRANNADPKWIVPVICRAGGVTKRDIGAIRIFDRETKFEIAEAAAADFAAKIRRPSGESVHIQPAAGALQTIRRRGHGDDERKPARRGPPKPGKSGPKSARS